MWQRQTSSRSAFRRRASDGRRVQLEVREVRRERDQLNIVPCFLAQACSNERYLDTLEVADRKVEGICAAILAVGCHHNMIVSSSAIDIRVVGIDVVGTGRI